MLVQPRENSTPHRHETVVFLVSGAIVIVLAFALRLFNISVRIDPLGVTTAVLFLALNTFLWTQLGKGVVRRLVDTDRISAEKEWAQTQKMTEAPSLGEESLAVDESESEENENKEPGSSPVRMGVFLLALFLKPLLLILLFVLLAHSSSLFLRSFLFGFIAHLIVAGGGLILGALSGHLTPAAVDSGESAGEHRKAQN